MHNPMPAVEELVTHRRGMSFLDEILGYGDDWLEAGLTITSASKFFTDGAVPGWVGMEYMAQAIAALAGTRSRAVGKKPKVGVLVRCRDFTLEHPTFAEGSQLIIRTEETFRDDNAGAYACSISCGSVIARADISAYIPERLEDIL